MRSGRAVVLDAFVGSGGGCLPREPLLLGGLLVGRCSAVSSVVAAVCVSASVWISASEGDGRFSRGVLVVLGLPWIGDSAVFLMSLLCFVRGAFPIGDLKLRWICVPWLRGALSDFCPGIFGDSGPCD